MDTLRRLARYLHIPLRAHHVTVHANGRCFILGKAVKRFRIPSGQPCVRVQLSGGQATLVFGPDGNALRHPSTKGKQYPGLYFYSRRLSRVAGPGRFRFAAPATACPDGTGLIRLTLTPVRDLYQLTINNG